jgi:ergothioneine biosynthesis protein EgtB
LAFAGSLHDRFRVTRRRTLDLTAPLTPEDMMVQSCLEASPVKWHLAHTAWFFESFILREFLPGYKAFHPDFVWLFNSYYQTFAAFPEKRLRSSFSRPALHDILRFRTYVDEHIHRLLESNPPAEALARIELGLYHEEQHQELILTDILHAFFTNPLRPVYLPASPELAQQSAQPHADPIRFIPHKGGLHDIGHSGAGFCFDNELPRHRVWLEPYSLADRLVTCAEFAEFIADGGYRRPELWLSDGWNAVQEQKWRAPLYWDRNDDDASVTSKWSVFTLHGAMSFDQVANSPVSHISFYEADAYAHWAGYRLPTEFEWEAAVESSTSPVQNENGTKCQDENSAKHRWEWTASAYLPYPGFHPLPGSLGEYNGKFMSGQMVLRGGSCCTPPGHARPSYRNFFAPATRWQFSGIRLARKSE